MNASLQQLKISVLSTSASRPPVSLSDIGIFDPAGYTLCGIEQRGLTVKVDTKQYQQTLSVNTGESDIKFVSGLVGCLESMKDQCKEALTKIPKGCKTPTAQLISDLILPFAMDTDSIQPPAFSNEVRYALHVGDGRNIREDHGWRLLARLRQILLGQVASRTSSEIPQDLSPDDIISVLYRMDWISGGSSEEMTRSQSFVRKAFAINESVTAENVKTSAGLVYLNRLAVRHYDKFLTTDVIGVNLLDIRSVSVGVNRCPDSASGLQYRSLVAVEQIKFDCQDSVFGLIKVVVGRESSKAAKSSTAEVTKDLLSLVNVQVGEARASILAGGIRAKVGLVGTDHIFLHQREVLEGTATSTITSSAKALELGLSQPDNAHSGVGGERIVIIFNINGAKSVLDIHGSKDAAKNVRALLSMDYLLFDSRPTLRRFMDFTQNWQEEQYP